CNLQGTSGRLQDVGDMLVERRFPNCQSHKRLQHHDGSGIALAIGRSQAERRSHGRGNGSVEGRIMVGRNDSTGEGESVFRKVRGALVGPAAGATLGFAVAGLFGVLSGLFCWILYGDAGYALSLGVSCAITGAAAGAVTGAVGRLIDGENPFAREEPPPESV